MGLAIWGLLAVGACATSGGAGASIDPDLKWVCDQGDPLAAQRGRITFEDVQRTLCYVGSTIPTDRAHLERLHRGALQDLSRCGAGDARAGVSPRIDNIRQLFGQLKTAAAASASQPGCAEKAMIQGMVGALGEAYAFHPVDAPLPTLSQELIEQIYLGVLNARVVYARFPVFPTGIHRRLQSEASRMRARQPIAGLILDLRGAQGGPLDEVVRLLDLFVDKGIILESRDRKGGVKYEHGTRMPVGLDGPVVVLIDKETVEGAEALAAGLRARGRGILLGRRTRGLATVGTTADLPSGSHLGLPLADLWTPGGGPITGHGVEPDVEVPSPERARDPLQPDPLVAWAYKVLVDSRVGSREELLELARRGR